MQPTPFIQPKWELDFLSSSRRDPGWELSLSSFSWKAWLIILPLSMTRREGDTVWKGM